MAIYGRRSQKADALADIPLFSSLSNKERMELARHVDELPIKNGTVLTKQGDAGDAFYLIVEGRADVIRNGTKVAKLGPGDVVGEMALLDGESRSATVMNQFDSTAMSRRRWTRNGALRPAPRTRTCFMTPCRLDAGTA